MLILIKNEEAGTGEGGKLSFRAVSKTDMATELSLFPEFDMDADESLEYTTKMGAPVYKPKNRKPSTIELIDDTKTKALIEKILASGVSEDEKKFLIEAARRHTVFFYNKIADFYAHSGPEVQRLMEDSALVIIDLGSAIQKGYVEFNKEIEGLFKHETNS